MIRRLLYAFLATLALFAVELFVSLSAHSARLASVWDVQWGSIWLGPTLLVAAAAGALLGLGLYELCLRGESRAARGVLAAGSFAAMALVAFGVGGGRHLATLPLRGGFALALRGRRRFGAALGAGLAVDGGARPLQRLR